MSYIAKPSAHHPALPKNALGLTRRDYEGTMSTLCAGCGHDSITAALIEACTARGYRQMIAVIGEPTNAASIGLHARFGFEHTGTMPGIAWKHGRWLDTVFMQRALGDGTSTPPPDPVGSTP